MKSNFTTSLAAAGLLFGWLATPVHADILYASSDGAGDVGGGPFKTTISKFSSTGVIRRCSLV